DVAVTGVQTCALPISEFLDEGSGVVEGGDDREAHVPHGLLPTITPATISATPATLRMVIGSANSGALKSSTRTKFRLMNGYALLNSIPESATIQPSAATTADAKELRNHGLVSSRPMYASRLAVSPGIAPVLRAASFAATWP